MGRLHRPGGVLFATGIPRLGGPVERRHAGANRAPWPLAADPSAFGAPAAASLGVDGLRSGVVVGAEAATLAGALATAAAGTTLTANGVGYRVWIEPLLPVELGG